jgi:hypothetical protein
MDKVKRFMVGVSIHDAQEYEDPYEDIMNALYNTGYDITFSIIEIEETENA